MRCLIIDDDEMARVCLRIICQQISGLHIIGELDNALCLPSYLQNNAVDLMFLDIEMPQFSGMDLVRSVDALPATILVTGKEAYAADAFNYLKPIIDFVVKPVSRQRLLLALQRYERTVSGMPPSAEAAESNWAFQDGFIFVKSVRRYVRIDLTQLLYVESSGDYSIFKTQDGGQYVVNTPLRDIEERLNHPAFVKVHRSFIVNLAKVKDIEDNSLLVKDCVIPISRSQRAKLMERIAPF
jgi:two-component system, LytTR family, response regulator LytT